MKSIPLSFKLLRVVVFFISALSLAPSATLRAQGVEPQAPQKELSGNILEPFAGAYKEISKIQTTYKERIIQANDTSQTDALQEEANQKMAQAVEDHGLTVADYNTIFKSIQNDPALKEKFMTVLNRTPSKG